MKFEAPNQILIKTIFGEVGKKPSSKVLYMDFDKWNWSTRKNKAWLAKTQQRQKKREKLCEIRRWHRSHFTRRLLVEFQNFVPVGCDMTCLHTHAHTVPAVLRVTVGFDTLGLASSSLLSPACDKPTTGQPPPHSGRAVVPPQTRAQTPPPHLP
jgi:hypothetical protein